MALNHGGSSCNPRILKEGLGLMAVCWAADIVGPSLYWHFMEGFAAVSHGSSLSSSALNCPPCECDCSFQSLLSIPIVDVQKKAQKNESSTPGLQPISGQTKDADSQTIFVNNVHFAATKDSISRHFNKSGEVLKVVILTDAATGQPKGLAYVEFMTKEAAENALSLDGTLFMSRILRYAARTFGSYISSRELISVSGVLLKKENGQTVMVPLFHSQENITDMYFDRNNFYDFTSLDVDAYLRRKPMRSYWL